MIINSEVFQMLFLLYLIIILIEDYITNLFNNFFDTNWLLGALIISGIIFIIDKKNSDELDADNSNNWFTYIKIIILGLVGSCLVYIKVMDLGWISWLISVLSGVIIILASYFFINNFLFENKTKKRKYKKNSLKINLTTTILFFIASFLLIFYFLVNIIGALAFIVSAVLSIAIALAINYFLIKFYK